MKELENEVRRFVSFRKRELAGERERLKLETGPAEEKLSFTIKIRTRLTEGKGLSLSRHRAKNILL